MKNFIITGIVFVALFVFMVLNFRNCTRANNAEAQVDGLRLDSARLVLKSARFELRALKCENEQTQTRLYATRVQSAIEAGEREVSAQVAKRSPRQQRVSALKGLVASKALTAERLPDTTNVTEVVVADTQLIASVDRLTGWYQVYKDSTAMLIESTAAQEAKIETLTGERRECQDEVADLRKLATRPRRGKFWVFVIRLFGGKA